MTDSIFIESMVKRGEEAREKVHQGFDYLSLQQLNWRPSDGGWSIGQCLDHLVITDCLYFPALQKITERNYKMNAWEKWSPFSGLFGKVLLNAVEENQVKKTNTARIFRPTSEPIDAVILERFYKHLDSLLGYIAGCSELNINKIRITSPVSKLVTTSFRNTILLCIEHQHRHINQALKVKAAKDFPAE